MQKNVENLHNLHSSTDILNAIKSRWMGWVEHIERSEEMRNGYKIYSESPKESDHLANLAVEGNITLKRILKLGCESLDCIHMV
jgi:hypothetical protein